MKLDGRAHEGGNRHRSSTGYKHECDQKEGQIAGSE